MPEVEEICIKKHQCHIFKEPIDINYLNSNNL